MTEKMRTEDEVDSLVRQWVEGNCKDFREGGEPLGKPLYRSNIFDRCKKFKYAPDDYLKTILKTQPEITKWYFNVFQTVFIAGIFGLTIAIFTLFLNNLLAWIKELPSGWNYVTWALLTGWILSLACLTIIGVLAFKTNEKSQSPYLSNFVQTKFYILQNLKELHIEMYYISKILEIREDAKRRNLESKQQNPDLLEACSDMPNENGTPKKILSLIEDYLKFFRVLGYDRLKNFSEEDTKVKLVLPFLRIPRWDLLDPIDIQMEASFYDDNIGKTSIVDCVLWTGEKRHIFLEIKSVNRSLPDPKYDPKSQLMLRYAKQSDASYAIFTNFLSRDMYNPKLETRIDNFPNPSHHLTRLDNLIRILRKPHKSDKTLLRDLPRCFGTFDPTKHEYRDCEYIEWIKPICGTYANLKT